jgi:hypothetical protein
MTLQELHDADEILDVYSYLTPRCWDNFWEKVDIRERDECWPWTGARNQIDYGIFCFYKGECEDKVIAAHKLAYIFGEQHALEQPITKGEVVMHKCRTRSSDRDHDLRYCCNPRHLKRGTQKENIWDAIEAGTFRPFGQSMEQAKYGRGKVVEEE